MKSYHFQFVKPIKKLQHEINNNLEILQLINEFEKAKVSYADVERYGGKYHPDYKDVSERLIEAKSNLFQNPSIKAFKACEKEIQSILDEIAKHISQTIESKLKRRIRHVDVVAGIVHAKL